MNICYNYECQWYDINSTDNCGNKLFSNPAHCPQWMGAPAGIVERSCSNCRHKQGADNVGICMEDNAPPQKIKNRKGKMINGTFVKEVDLMSMAAFQQDIREEYDQVFPHESTPEPGHNNGGSTDYYDFEPQWKECQDIIEAREMNFSQGNIFKASFCFGQSRHEATNYERELNKIIFFAHRELKRIGAE